MERQMIPPEALQRYIAGRHADLAHCQDSLRNNDFEPIRAIGHNLKGNGLPFGFPELSQIGEKLELSANQRDRIQISSLLDQLLKWIQTHPN